ncbi:MAG: lytic transglycosylase domain-containing protein [Chloroflexi bacterium]|nr:lytic transglycosylase domain-containing protein [Chloroflexota bacterium]
MSAMAASARAADVPGAGTPLFRPRRQVSAPVSSFAATLAARGRAPAPSRAEVQSKPVAVTTRRSHLAAEKGAATSAASSPRRMASPSQGAGSGSAYDGLFFEMAERYGVDPTLVAAVARAESGYRRDAVSSAGAKGLMQLMDPTARALRVTDSFDPAQNVDGGTRFLKTLLDRFGSTDLALAAYNAGPGAVARFGGIPPYAETQTFVRRVRDFQREIQGRQTGEVNS